MTLRFICRFTVVPACVFREIMPHLSVMRMSIDDSCRWVFYESKRSSSNNQVEMRTIKSVSAAV